MKEQEDFARENLELIHQSMQKTRFNLRMIGFFVLLYGLFGAIEQAFWILDWHSEQFDSVVEFSKVARILGECLPWVIRIVWVILFLKVDKRGEEGTKKLLLIWGVVLIVFPMLDDTIYELVPGNLMEKYGYFSKLMALASLSVGIFLTGRIIGRKVYIVLSAIVLAFLVAVVVVWYMHLYYYLKDYVRLLPYGICIITGVMLMIQKWNVQEK